MNNIIFPQTVYVGSSPELQSASFSVSIPSSPKSVLITGSRGQLGNACVGKGRELGWIVHPLVRSELDLSHWKEVETWAKDRHETYDLVIMAHGTQMKSTISEMDIHKWDNILADNLTSCAALTHALMQNNLVNKGGLVVYISSIQASQPRSGRGAYAAAKAGLEGYMRAVSVELLERQARAIALRLGQMTIPMNGIRFAKDEWNRIKERIPLPWVSNIDTANLIFSFYNQPSLTGQVIEISSGHSGNIW